MVQHVEGVKSINGRHVGIRVTVPSFIFTIVARWISLSFTIPNVYKKIIFGADYRV